MQASRDTGQILTNFPYIMYDIHKIGSNGCEMYNIP